jgi:hypothetical protein
VLAIGGFGLGSQTRIALGIASVVLGAIAIAQYAHTPA